jgi:phasin family protein
MTRKTIAFKVLGAGPELESWIESCEAPFAPQAEREPATAAVTAGRPVSMDGDPPTQRTQLPALSSPSRMAPTAASNTLSLYGMQELSREWFGIVNDRAQQNLAQLSSALNCRTPADLLCAQSTFLCSSLEHVLEDSARLAQLAAQVALNAAHAVRAHRNGYF